MHSRASVRAMGMLSGLLSVVWLGACGSGGEPGAAEPSPPAATSSAGTSSMPASQPSVVPGVGPSASPSQQPATPSQQPATPSQQPATPSPTPSGAGAEGPPGDGAAALDACTAVGGSDACGACVCSACKSDLDACLAVDGCAEILACVRESGCSGRDCYCGDARLTECVRGEANGPCMEAVLAAPGGKAPSLEDPSGGPASDAAQRVADCAGDDDTCKDVCGLAD